MKLFQPIEYADAAALESNHSSQFILDTLETFQVLSADTHQSRIGLVKLATYEWTSYYLGTVPGERWTDVSEGSTVGETWFGQGNYASVKG